MAEIQLKGVTKRYPDGTEAVKSMDLDIGDGEFMILVGPSGCGKSTALRMIAGLEDISEGELIIGGEVVNDLAPKDRDIAMVFQNYALYPHMTVRENMGFALKLAKVAPGGDQEQGGGGRAHPRPDPAPRPQARQPLRRPAPARRHGPRDRAQPEGLPDGRAAVEPRRQAARADAHRGLADPAAARHDHRLRDPRPDRGHDPRRPRRRHAARRRAPAGRHAEGALRGPDQPVRRRLHRLARHELPAGAPGGRHDQAAVRRRSAFGRAALQAPRRRQGPRRHRRHPPRALRGRRGGRRAPDHGHEVPHQDRRRRVDGLRALRLLRRREQGDGVRGAQGARAGRRAP